MDRSIPVRAISRGFAILSIISRDGPVSMTDIANRAELPYATTRRIVQTLLHEGMIDRTPDRRRYQVTSLVQSLATGFQQDDLLAELARPHIEELCRKIGWPVSIATRVGTRMMIRASTHQMTSLTFTNYYPGFTLPIAESATGKAYLANCADTERVMIGDAWEATDNEASQVGLSLLADADALRAVREQGYAMQGRNLYNFEPGKTSSIAVPIRDASGRLAGSMALIYFVAAIKTAEAPGKFLTDMQATAAEIGASLSRADIR